MFNYSAAPNGLGTVLILALFATLALGLVIGNSELLNPRRAQIEQELAQVKVEQSRAQSEIDRQAQIQKMQQRAALAQALQQALNEGISFLFRALGVGIVVGLILISASLSWRFVRKPAPQQADTAISQDWKPADLHPIKHPPDETSVRRHIPVGEIGGDGHEEPVKV